MEKAFTKKERKKENLVKERKKERKDSTRTPVQVHTEKNF